MTITVSGFPPIRIWEVMNLELGELMDKLMEAKYSSDPEALPSPDAIVLSRADRCKFYAWKHTGVLEGVPVTIYNVPVCWV